MVKDAHFVLRNYFYDKSFVLKLTAIPKMESFEYSPSSFLLHVFAESVDEDEVSNLLCEQKMKTNSNISPFNKLCRFSRDISF